MSDIILRFICFFKNFSSSTINDTDKCLPNEKKYSLIPKGTNYVDNKHFLASEHKFSSSPLLSGKDDSSITSEKDDDYRTNRIAIFRQVR